MSRVGKKLSEARQLKGITQKALAKKVGVNEKFINDVECGRKIINEAMISKISKILNVDLNDVSMIATDEDLQKEKKEVIASNSKSFKSKNASKEINETWNMAFGSVLKNVPIYDYSLNKNKGFKEMAVHSKKIDGYHQDKVCFIEIEEDDMTGFRIFKGDLAFINLTKEIENNSICLLEYEGKRIVRQIKVIDSTKVLLVSNNGRALTSTVYKKELNIIGKLNKIEFNL